jgi:hypothetical protein
LSALSCRTRAPPWSRAPPQARIGMCHRPSLTFHVLRHVVRGKELRAPGGVCLVARQAARPRVAPGAPVLGQLARTHAAHHACLRETRARPWGVRVSTGAKTGSDCDRGVVCVCAPHGWRPHPQSRQSLWLSWRSGEFTCPPDGMGAGGAETLSAGVTCTDDITRGDGARQYKERVGGLSRPRVQTVGGLSADG